MLSALFYVLIGIYIDQEYQLPSIKNLSIYIFKKYKEQKSITNKINESYTQTNDLSNTSRIYNKIKEYMNI